MPPIDKSEGGDFHIVNGTFIKLKDIGAQYNLVPGEDGEKTEEKTEEQSEDQHPDEEAGDGSEEPKEIKRHAERRRKRKAERRGISPGKEGK